MSEHPRRVVTILFTDIVGSTRLWEELPDKMATALARHDTLLTECIERNRGSVVKGTGDGFMAIFSQAQEGISSAVAAQHALDEESWDAEIGRLQVRMALHTGTVEEREHDYHGTAVNRAARLVSAGHGGQILLSETTYDLVWQELPPGLMLKDLGRHRLKDISQAENVFQLVTPNLTTIFPSLRTPQSNTTNLPVQLTPFIGRVRETNAVSELVTRPEVSLITLIGPGGTGKTRLALQVAQVMAGHFADGVTFVALAATKDPSLVPDAVARTIGVIEQPDHSLVDSVGRYFANKEALLVLDNFEQVLEAGSFITAMLATAPQLTILVTSRAVLHLRGEHEYPVPPLVVPDLNQSATTVDLSTNEAVSLFVERALATSPNFELTEENAKTVAAICVGLDGLPLAIELAAARVRIFSPQQILDRLDNRLHLLTGGALDLPSRQRTLRNAIDWSYNLLDEGEQQLFARLSVFTGGRSLEAIEAVCDPGIAIDTLYGTESLLNKSLLVRGEGPGGESRFFMLETIHEYAAERLVQSGEEEQIEDRHLEYFLSLAEEMEPGYRQHGQLELIERTEAELGNIRAAFNYAMQSDQFATAAKLIASIDYYLRYRDRLVEGQRWFQRLLGVMDKIPEAYQARFLLAAGRLAWVNGALEQSHHLLLRGLELAQALNDRRIEAWTLVELSAASFAIDGHSLNEKRAKSGLSIFQDLDDRVGIATAFNNLGEIARLAGDYDQAREMYESCLAACRETGEIIRQIMQSHNLGYIAYRQGDYERARDLNISCLEQMIEIGWRHGTVDTLWNLAGPLTWLGEEEKAVRLLGASAALLVEMGVAPHPSDIRELSLYTADARAQLDEAVFETLYAEGWAMTVEQAIDYALEA